MYIEAPSFVIQRRIAYPLPDVHRGLADRAPIGTATLFELGSHGFFHINEPLRPMAPMSSRQPMPTWRACARLLTDRRRVVAMVELTVSM
jgi:hypothetical protein